MYVWTAEHDQSPLGAIVFVSKISFLRYSFAFSFHHPVAVCTSMQFFLFLFSIFSHLTIRFYAFSENRTTINQIQNSETKTTKTPHATLGARSLKSKRIIASQKLNNQFANAFTNDEKMRSIVNNVNSGLVKFLCFHFRFLFIK